MSYVVTILKPVYSEHGVGVDDDGRAFDMEPEEEIVLATQQAACLRARQEIVSYEPEGGYRRSSSGDTYGPASPEVWRQWEAMVDTGSGGIIGPLPDGTMIEITSDGHLDGLVRAIYDSVAAVVARGNRSPSVATSTKALRLIAGPGASYRDLARVYLIPGDTREHMVALYLEHQTVGSSVVSPMMVLGARCDCPHAVVLHDPDACDPHRGVCSHIIGALALANLEGIYLKESTK